MSQSNLDRKEFVSFVLKLALTAYVFVAVIMVYYGGLDKKTDGCDATISRVEYVAPWYEVGCWLAGDV